MSDKDLYLEYIKNSQNSTLKKLQLENRKKQKTHE